MARKRMIAPDFWTDEKLGQCSRDERLFFMGLISNADDEGRGRGNIKLLKAAIFPYDDDLKAKDVEEMAISLMGKGMVIFYVAEGQDFYCLPNFSKHQVINKPSESKIPPMPVEHEDIVLPDYCGSTTVALLPNRKELKGREVKLNEKKIRRAEFVALTDEEYDALVERFGEKGARDRIENLSLYKGSKGIKYESDYMTILAWERRDSDRASPSGADSKIRAIDQYFGTGDNGCGPKRNRQVSKTDNRSVPLF